MSARKTEGIGRLILGVACALATYLIVIWFRLFETGFASPLRIAFLVLFAAAAVSAYLFVFRMSDLRCLIWSLVWSTLLSFAFVFGHELDEVGYLYGAGSTFLAIALLAVAFTPACYSVFRLLATAKAETDERKSHDVTHGKTSPIQSDDSPCIQTATAAESNVRKFAIACLIALGAVWMLWYLVLFPGIFGYDAAYWYLEYSDPTVPVLSQWSIPYSWVYYRFISWGYDVCGSYDIGFAVFAGLQMTFVFYAACRMVRLIAYRQKHRWPIVASVAFLAFVPPIPMLAVSSAQDAMFMGCFGLLCVHLIEMMDDPAGYWALKRQPIAFMCVALLFCLVRNNGFFALLVSLIFIPLYAKGYRRQLLVALLVPMVIVQIYQGPVEDALGVTKGTALREMLSIPAQQMARVYTCDANTLTDDELTTLEFYLPETALVHYEDFPSISDQIKGGLNTDAIAHDPLDFACFYLSIGITHKTEYFEAACMNSLGLWYPDKGYPDSRMWHPYLESECSDISTADPRYVQIDSLSLLPRVDATIQYLYGWGQQHFDETPLVGLFSRSGTYFFLLLFECAFALYARRFRTFIVLGPCLALMLTVFLGPVVLCRYIAPIMFVAPLLCALPFERTPAMPSMVSPHGR